MKRPPTIALLLLALTLLAGCKADSTAAAIDLQPEDIGTAECAVCGMTVRDQPAPRGQLVHRDGQHQHLCSLGDLRAYLQTPSSLGQPVAVWVEDLGDGFDLAAPQTDPHPWLPASEATYVVGLERGGIMGKPILSFSRPVGSADLRSLPGAYATTWAALRSTPFHQLPAEIP